MALEYLIFPFISNPSSILTNLMASCLENFLALASGLRLWANGLAHTQFLLTLASGGPLRSSGIRSSLNLFLLNLVSGRPPRSSGKLSSPNLLLLTLASGRQLRSSGIRSSPNLFLLTLASGRQLRSSGKWSSSNQFFTNAG